MQLWVLLLLMGLLKVPIAALMLWIPLRSDHAMDARADAAEQPGSDDGGGGSKTLPEDPRRPHPRGPFPTGPRRGPHGSPPPPSPARIRHRHERPAPVRIEQR